jgi:hypothetical protein
MCINWELFVKLHMQMKVFVFCDFILFSMFVCTHLFVEIYAWINFSHLCKLQFNSYLSTLIVGIDGIWKSSY